MKFNKIIKTFAVSMALVVSSTNVISAATFADVPSSHWAYSAIDSVSDKGLIVGDINGKFNPNSYVDKFSTSKIIARLLGYKATGATAAEQLFYDTAYSKNQSFLTLYKSKFSKWDSSADREISFLLEKGVLTSADLDQFIIVSKNTNTEALTAITREDIALLLVRAMGEANQASTYKSSNLFKDDSKITSSKKSSVYYLRDKNIINGDSSNNFNPKTATTKAALAVLLNKTYSYMYGDTSLPTVTTTDIENTVNTNTTTTPNTESNNSTTTTVTAVSGTIKVYYESLNTIQMNNDNGATQIYRIDDNASITIDGVLSTPKKLKAGMYIIGVVTDGKVLIELKATTNNTSNNTTTDTTNTKEESKDSTKETSSSSNEKFDIEGLVSNVDTTKSTLSVDTRIINPRGEIITTTKVYNVPSSAVIKRASKDTTLNKVSKGDIIYGKVEGDNLVEINLEAKDITVYGTVIERSFDTVNEKSYYLIQDEDDTKKTYKLYTDSSSVLKRSGSGTVSFKSIKIGDSVEAYATFNVITELYATGKSSYVSGKVTDIFISQNESYLVVDKSSGDKEVEKFYAQHDLKYLYDVEIGSTVELTLDSKEIAEIDKISTSSTSKLVTGYVNSVSRDRIVIRDSSNASSASSTVYFNSSTSFLRSSTGLSTNAGLIEENDQIIVSYSSSNSDYANTITVIK